MSSSVTVYQLPIFISLAVGQDFILSRTEVTFDVDAINGSIITVFVDVINDLFVEGAETFTLSGTVGVPAADGAVFVGGPVTVTILDDDGKIMYASESHELSMSACNGTHKFL